tara:strand:- start:547 stop:831 length:285 start_codon:yes stop_codon:yes gene_type:complete
MTLKNSNANADKVIEKILNRLGKPPYLHHVDATNVYSNKWRVNVWIEDVAPGMVAKSYEIKHSFFCELTDSGSLKVTPKIERLYKNGKAIDEEE